MSATLANLRLSLEQTSDQRQLRVVNLSYDYELTHSVDPGAQGSTHPFQVDIDIIGDDVLSDDILASRVDAHEVNCPVDATVAISRQFTVAQGVLDEDVGDDEIKVRIRVTRHSEPVVEAITPIVKGKF